jgi:hypothetical protein
VSKDSTPKWATLEIAKAGEPRASRIRREPPPPAKQRLLIHQPTEREAWTVAIGVLLFGIAIAIIILGFSDYTSR